MNDSDEFARDNCGLLDGDRTMKMRIKGVTFAEKVIEVAIVDGLAVFEGCCVVGRVGGLEGIAITGDRFRWPNAIMPYEIAPELPNQDRVHDAIRHWTENTKVKFVARTGENANDHRNYVRFILASGCWSFVGMQGGMQEIGLAAGCSTGNTIHEIGHAWGLWHEQSREDRNNHLEIHFENVLPGREHNFNQNISDGDDIGGHDFGSIMHYGRFAFSKNGEPTITTKPSGNPIGQRTSLSDGDVQAIHQIYGL